MSIVSNQVLETILDHLDSSKLDLDMFSDKDLLKLILFMLLEQRKINKPCNKDITDVVSPKL